jgi:hypothetical protein
MLPLVPLATSLALAALLAAAAPSAPADASPPAESASDEAAEAPGRARLRGRVLTFGEREPVSGARLIFEDGRTPLETDDKGAFSVDLPPGEHVLIVRAPGFNDLRSSVSLSDKQDLELEYRLEKNLDGRAYRTEVTAEREVAVSSTRLRDDEIRAVPGTRGDPLGVVKSLPGVSQLAGFLPYAVVRGAAPGNTGYYLDGSRVPILFHVAIGPSVIHPYFIDSVDFYPSGAPVRLGRFASGIIEARTVPARRDRVHGDVDLRLTDAGGLLEVPIDRRVLPGCKETKKRRARCDKGPARGALTLAGRYSYTAGVVSLLNLNTRIAFWDYQARFDHSLGDRLNFTAFAYGSFDDLGQKEDIDENGDTFEPEPILKFQFHRLDTRLRQRLPNDGQAQYAVVFGLDESGFGGFDPQQPSAQTNEWRVAPRIDFNVPVAKRTAVNFGFDQEVQFFRLDNPLGDLGDLGNVEDLALVLSERNVYGSGLYFDVAHKRERFEIRPGIRTDFYAQTGSSPYLTNARGITHAVGIDPRLLIRERVIPRLWLKQTLGIYHQPPSFPIPIPGIESFGFERGLQRNTQGSAGYDLALVDGKLLLSQDVYLGRLSNLQDYELAAATDGTADAGVDELEDVIALIDGWAYGVETMLKLDASLKMFGWAAYTLSRSTRDFETAGRRPSNWDQRHIINVVLGYRFSHKWNVGGRIHYHTGRPWTSPQTGQDAVTALNSNRNNARLPPFFQLDLRVERVWRWPDWQLSLSLDVSNSTYSNEVFLCTPNTDSTDETPAALRTAAYAARTMAQSAGIAGCSAQGFRYIVPSLGLRARW